MFDERVYEIIEKDPSKAFLETIAKNKILIISPNTEKYLDDVDKLFLSENKKVSKKLFIDMISHDDTFEKIKKIYEKGSHGVYVCYVREDGSYVAQHNFSRMSIIDLIKQIDIEKEESITERCKLLLDYVSYDKYKERTKNNNYEISIDGKEYKIPIRLIYQFIESDTDYFYSVIKNNDSYEGIPIRVFLYAVNDYYKKNDILENYDLDSNLRMSIDSKLTEIRSSKTVDIEMVNSYLDTNTFFDNIEINRELHDYIMCGIPSDFDELEKALYIYIKMCKTLTYDEEYFAVNQKGPLSLKHKTIDYIKNISLEKNEVVCFEFNAIYSKLLKELGINYKHYVGTVNGYNEQDEQEFDEDFFKYSEGHEFIKFRCGKFLVKADSVTTILLGDIMKAKFNQPLLGLCCENKNEQTVAEFNKILYKVYKYISENEPRISPNKVDETESFEEIVEEFVGCTDKMEVVDIRDKVDILITKVNSTKTSGIDAFSYLLQLRKILFSEQEQKDNIKISVIRKSGEDYAKTTSVISTKIPNSEGEVKVRRYIFNPGSPLVPITQEELQEQFDNGSMGYVQEQDPKIPGIKVGV